MVELSILSTLVFFLIFMFCLMLYAGSSNFQHGKHLNLIDYSVCIIYAVLVGFRKAGLDQELYYDNIVALIGNGAGGIYEVTFEPFHLLIIYIIQFLNCSVSWYFFIIAYGQFYLLLRFLKRWYRKEAPFIIFFFFTTLVFIESLNAMRQILATLFVLNFFELIEKRKMLQYCIGVGFASLIHSSAVLFLPLYFVIYKPLFANNRMALISFYSSIFVLAEFIFASFFQYMSQIVDMLMLMSEKAKYLSDETEGLFIGDDAESSFGFAAVFRFVVTCFFIINANKYLLHNRMTQTLFNFAFIGCCLACISGTSIFFIRLNYYFIDYLFIPLGIMSYNIIHHLDVNSIIRRNNKKEYLKLRNEHKMIPQVIVDNLRKRKLKDKYYYARLLALMPVVLLHLLWMANSVMKSAAACSPYTLFYMF